MTSITFRVTHIYNGNVIKYRFIIEGDKYDGRVIVLENGVRMDSFNIGIASEFETQCESYLQNKYNDDYIITVKHDLNRVERIQNYVDDWIRCGKLDFSIYDAMPDIMYLLEELKNRDEEIEKLRNKR